VLKAQINKTDRNDARGIAQTGDGRRPRDDHLVATALDDLGRLLGNGGPQLPPEVSPAPLRLFRPICSRLRRPLPRRVA
jgi:hypothetical protein